MSDDFTLLDPDDPEVISGAVQVWSILQGRATTINEAALTFNVQPTILRAAINDHPWMGVNDKDVIWHEGTCD